MADKSVMTRDSQDADLAACPGGNGLVSAHLGFSGPLNLTPLNVENTMFARVAKGVGKRSSYPKPGSETE